MDWALPHVQLYTTDFLFSWPGARSPHFRGIFGVCSGKYGHVPEASLPPDEDFILAPHDRPRSCDEGRLEVPFSWLGHSRRSLHRLLDS